MSAAVEVRAAAVEALGQLKPPQAQADARSADRRRPTETRGADPLAEAAVRTLPRLGDATGRLVDLLRSADAPLGLRREALRSLAVTSDGAQRLLEPGLERTSCPRN